MKGGYTLIFIVITLQIHAQLNLGELMFVGYNADGNDGFSVLNLADIPANSTIYFTDNEWNGSAIGAGGAFNSASEGEITWSTGASIITAGTITNFTETNNSVNVGYGASNGTISGAINLNASNEVLYAFLGTNNITPTLFLSAIANDGFSNTKGTLTNTGLTSGTNATSITGDEDVMVYTGNTTCNNTIADCAALIANATNWTTQDGSGDQSADAVAPDYPTDVPVSFGGTLLPIDLVSFKVVEKEHGFHIKWATASELNNDYYEIFRSLQGDNFEIIAKIVGFGTTSEYHEYSYFDTLSSNIESAYYKLKQTDFDGKNEWFNVVYVKRELTFSKLEEPKIIIYPNPTNGNLVFVESNANIQNVQVFDFHGKDVVSYSNVENRLVEIGYLPIGNYIIKVISSEFAYYNKLVVNK